MPRERERNGNWRGGRRKVRDYVAILAPDHPRASRGYVLEHIIVAERALGRALPASAVVHHINDVGSENDADNLVICESQGYHLLIHARRRVYRAGGDPNRDKICGTCKRVLPRSEFHAAPSQPDGLYARCRPCHAAKACNYRAAECRCLTARRNTA